jgi:hypothetical protein
MDCDFVGIVVCGLFFEVIVLTIYVVKIQFSANSAPLRENKLFSRRGAEFAENS